MNTLLVLSGLPGAGKSFYAKEFAKNPRWKRINKDDLRAMFDGGVWSGKNERHIVHARNIIVKYWLGEGYNVLVDDTNLNPQHAKDLKLIADDSGAVFEVKFIDTDIETCVKNDLNRLRSVGADVIYNMYNKYLDKRNTPEYNPDIPSCVICDLDGTLADNSKRNPYSAVVLTDTVIQPTFDMIKALAPTYPIVLLSGRSLDAYPSTIQWLQNHGILDYIVGLFMRNPDDKRSDDIVKEELCTLFVEPHYNIAFVIDDRPQVIRMWKKKGFHVFNTDRRMYYSEF